jgi:murein DD-endopeptidase MepM/ murein hydrolase activator NlpD
MAITIFSIFIFSNNLLGDSVQSPEIPVVLISTSTPTISLEDAAIANSEWSGALTEKTPLPQGTPIIIPTIPPTPTALPVQNVTVGSSVNPTGIPSVLISSPLEGFSIADLQTLISQEFKAPPPGEDSGHHGVDFAFWSLGEKHILGTPIQAVFPGKVAMVDSQEKPPYGFAIMIESPLDSISQQYIHAIKIPTQPIGTNLNNKLNCPDLSMDTWNSSSKSLYTLYGHMIAASPLIQGDSVQGGQVIGHVGNSGLSSAPHLHLEMRIGPSGTTFTQMGHYDPNTTEEDRHNYCNWRVSGVFQMFDPMDLFKASLVTK